MPDITSRMKSYSFGRTGLFTVTLVNGQTWAQIDSEDKHPHWDRRADQYVVTISAGAFVRW